MHKYGKDERKDDGKHRSDVVEAREPAENTDQPRPQAEDGYDGRSEEPQYRVFFAKVSFSDQLEGRNKKGNTDDPDEETDVKHRESPQNSLNKSMNMASITLAM